MKKFITLILSAAMCLSLSACGASAEQLEEAFDKLQDLKSDLAEANGKIAALEERVNVLAVGNSTPQADTESVGSTADKQDKVNGVADNTSPWQEETADSGDEFVSLDLGDAVTLDFVEFTVDSASWSDIITPTDTDGVYSYKADNENESYFWLCGTMKNTSGNAYSVEDMVSEIVFDNKYTYTAHLAADDGGNDFYGDYVKPLSSVKYYIYISAPDEIKDIYSTVTVNFGFEENFGGSYYDDFEDCDYLYSVDLYK